MKREKEVGEITVWDHEASLQTIKVTEVLGAGEVPARVARHLRRHPGEALEDLRVEIQILLPAHQLQE